MLGSTVSTRGGYHTGFKRGDKWGCKAIQIYITLSRQWKVLKLKEEEIKKFKEEWEKSSVKEVVAHIPYLVNLASSNEEVFRKSKDRLITEIKRANKLGVRLLVLHPGSYSGDVKEKGIKKVTQTLNDIFKEVDTSSVKVLIETMAGQGNSLGSSFEEIAAILDGVEEKEAVGVCFDTAHVFAAGYSFKGYDGYNKVMDEFEKYIPLDKILAFHLNGSKRKKGSHKDRHASIGEGEIGIESFRALMQDKRFKKVPKVLEIPNLEEKAEENLNLLRNYEK